jgi:hypothetical protein
MEKSGLAIGDNPKHNLRIETETYLVLLLVCLTVCVIRMFLCGAWHQRILKCDTAAGTLKGRER